MTSKVSYRFGDPQNVWMNRSQMRRALSRDYAGEIELIQMGGDNDTDVYRAEGRFKDVNFALTGFEAVTRVDVWGSEQGMIEVVQALEKIVGVELIRGKPVRDAEKVLA